MSADEEVAVTEEEEEVKVTAENSHNGGEPEELPFRFSSDLSSCVKATVKNPFYKATHILRPIVGPDGILSIGRWISTY